MTRLIHDQFAKDYLEDMLSPYGEVRAARPVVGEVREIDVWYEPSGLGQASPSALGLLGRLAGTKAMFEPFRNPAKPHQICNCLLKLLEVLGETEREANRKKQKLGDRALPNLWIITPTASAEILNGFHAKLDEEWEQGIYFLGEHLRTAIIVVHKLPRNRETLWLRVLGRGTVQSTAIDELEALPKDNPSRAIALNLLYNLRKNLEANANINTTDRKLIMRLKPLYQQDREEAIREGMQQGIQQGTQQGTQVIIENLLRSRFGSIDEELAAAIPPMMALPQPEFTELLLQFSQIERQELLARFGKD